MQPSEHQRQRGRAAALMSAMHRPLDYARRLTGAARSAQGNRHLGIALAFVAGATNAGGFLAVQQYTSHMTGIVSSLADNAALGAFDLVLGGIGALLSFLLGAACSAVMVNYARRQGLHSEYAAPLLLEGALLVCFGVLGARLSHTAGPFVPMTVALLCFIMGLQNALMTKLSRAEVRTTHVTGMVTDIGIELGKLFYWNGGGHAGSAPVRADRVRLANLGLLVGAFFGGGLAGALGFRHAGFASTIPLACLLVLMGLVPAADDALSGLRKRSAR